MSKCKVCGENIQKGCAVKKSYCSLECAGLFKAKYNPETKKWEKPV